MRGREIGVLFMDRKLRYARVHRVTCGVRAGRPLRSGAEVLPEKACPGEGRGGNRFSDKKHDKAKSEGLSAIQSKSESS
jgi:hypothetical protein